MPTTPSRSKAVAATALLAAAGLTLAACSNDASSPASASTGSSGGSGHVTIGFSPVTLQAPALKGLADGITGYAKSKGWSVLTADPKGDPATQKQQIDGWVQRGQVDALWIIPSSSTALQASVKAAQAKGIVVLASGKPADYGFSGPDAGVSFSYVDNATYGKTLGEQLAGCVNDRLGGNAKVIDMAEPPNGTSAYAEIDKAFRATLAAKAPGATIVASPNSGADRLKAQQNTASALQGNADANALVGTNDEATLGALGAFEAAGKDPAQICAVGAGGGDEAVADAKSGKLYAELSFDFAADMVQTADLLAHMAKDPKAKGEIHTVPLKLVTR